MTNQNETPSPFNLPAWTQSNENRLRHSISQLIPEPLIIGIMSPENPWNPVISVAMF